MADLAAMEIIIGADVQKAVTGLNAVQKELAETAVSAGKTDSSLQKMSKGTGQATTAMSNLSRIVQDAPFGFIGISNNIDPLLQSFQQLKKESGSVGGALKAMAGSLTGAAGLGLAVSVVTSLLVVFGDKLFNTSKAADEAAKAIDSINESAAKNILQFRELTGVAADTNQSMEVRLGAVQKLKSEYPNYLKNLSDEQILTGELGKAYEDVNNALIAKAALQAAEEKIIPIIKKQVELKLKQKEAQEFLNKTQPVSKEELSKYPQLGRLYVERLHATQDVTKATGELLPVQTELNNLMAGLSDILRGSAPLDTIFKPETVKKQADATKELRTTLPTLDEYLKLSRQIYDLSKTAAITPISTNILPTTPGQLTGRPGLQLPVAKIDQATKGMKFLSDNMEEIMKATQQLQAVFENVFTAMAEGGQSAIQSLIHSLEQLLTKLAAAAAAAAVLSLLTSGITGAPGFGEIFGKLSGLGNIFKFQHGGIITGPTLGLIGEAGPEVVFPLDRLREFLAPASSQVIVLETRLSGNDIFLSQSRTAQRRGRTY